MFRFMVFLTTIAPVARATYNGGFSVVLYSEEWSYLLNTNQASFPNHQQVFRRISRSGAFPVHRSIQPQGNRTDVGFQLGRDRQFNEKEG